MNKYKIGMKVSRAGQIGEILDYNEITSQYAVQWYRYKKPSCIGFHDVEWFDKFTEIIL